MKCRCENYKLIGWLDTDGNVVLYETHAEVDTFLPDGSRVEVFYRRPNGIVLLRADAERLGIEIDENDNYGGTD